MAKLTEIKVDTTSFNVKYWGKKTLEEFMAEAKKEGAGMIPEDVEPKDHDEWLKIAHDQIVRAYNGDETVLPEVSVDAIKEAEAAAQAEAPKKTTKKTAEGEAPKA